MSHTGNSISLVCYDITSDKLRRKIDKAMKDFGIRLQLSIFICRLNREGMDLCRDRLRKILIQHRHEKKPGDSLIIIERVQPENTDSLLGTKIEQEKIFKVM